MDRIIKLIYCAKLSPKFKSEWEWWIDDGMMLLTHTDAIYITRIEMQKLVESIRAKKWKWAE
jgi:hypothetical protein